MCAADCTSCPAGKVKPNYSRGKSSLIKKTRFEDWWFKAGDYISLTILVFAFLYGKLFIKENEIDLFKEMAPQIEFAQISSFPVVFEFESKEDSITGKIQSIEAQGYGGPMKVATVVDKNADIYKVVILSQKETKSFYNKLLDNNFFRQFTGRIINQKFIIGNDVDAVSGATVSSKAFTKAIREASHSLASTHYNLNIPVQEEKWIFGWKEALLIGMFILSYITLRLKNKKLRFLNLAIGFIFIGFYFNASISISYFANVFMGYLPSFYDNIFWYILTGVTLLAPLLIGKNLYCTTMCPFHAMQIILFKIGGFKFSLTRKLHKYSKYATRRVLFLALLVVFITDNPTLGSFEPFSMAFSLEGTGVQWYILPASLVGAILISDFFCRYFCPVGETLKFLLKTRSNIIVWTKNIIGYGKRK